MTFVVSFDDAQPGARFDTIPFDRARIEEAAAEAGPYTAIETITLSPLDSDPANPAVRDLTTDQATLESGWYRIVFLDANDGAEVSSAVYSSDVVLLDPNDIRVMVPRVRRAVEGVEGATLTDDQVKDLVADAVASVILYTGSAFGRQLLVTHRDAQGIPDEYATDSPLTLPQQTVIAAQAALDHAWKMLVGFKTSETIRDEAQEWSYTVSAQAIRDAMKSLKDERDKALSALDDGTLAEYSSFVAVRDIQTSRAVEPWVDAAGFGGQEGDVRFGTAL